MPAASATMPRPSKASASARLGVSTVTSGNSSCCSTFSASGSSRARPLLEHNTGSSTTTGTGWRRSIRATRRITAAWPSIPILRASTCTSSSTACSWSLTRSAASTCTRRTPQVFWATMAVVTAMPYTPQAAKVFRSAWIPAPPLGSVPAMLSTLATFRPAAIVP